MPRPCRIGIDARMYASGFTGIGRYVFELIRHLAKLDQKNHYIVFLNPKEFRNFRPPAKNFQAVRVNAPHYSLAEQTSFLTALRKAKLNLMHFTHFNAPLLYTGRSVVTIHDLTLSFYPGQKMISPLHRLAYNAVLRRSVSGAQKIITVSENTKKDLRKLLNTPTRKIQVIHNGIGPEFHPAKSVTAVKKILAYRYSITSDYLLYTGVWRNHKNILGLLTAFARLRREKNFPGRLVITGRTDPIYAPAIFSALDELSLRKAVIFAGLVPEEDLIHFYQAARTFVFPSFYEGFGLPPLEAMATGVPVTASDTSSIPEICGSNNALFFDPHDSADMADKIYKTWTNISLRKKLVKRGKKRAQNFRWNKMAQKTLAIYREILIPNKLTK